MRKLLRKTVRKLINGRLQLNLQQQTSGLNREAIPRPRTQQQHAQAEHLESPKLFREQDA
jgi:hypothetical protein